MLLNDSTIIKGKIYYTDSNVVYNDQIYQLENISVAYVKNKHNPVLRTIYTFAGSAIMPYLLALLGELAYSSGDEKFSWTRPLYYSVPIGLVLGFGFSLEVNTPKTIIFKKWK